MAQTELVDKDLEDKYGELIPNELNETKQHYINELNTLLENYQPSDKILMFTLECIISIAIFAIGLSIGLVGLLIITILAMFIIVKLGGPSLLKTLPSKKKNWLTKHV